MEDLDSRKGDANQDEAESLVYFEMFSNTCKECAVNTYGILTTNI